MNIFEKAIFRIDTFQRRHKFTAFAFGVQKRYGDDQVGYQAALVTYYGFLSLFPLLLILTTVAGMIGAHDPALSQRIINSVSSYFPVLGKSLEDSVHYSAKSSLALAIGLLLSLYGARGIADAFRHAANHIWHIPLGRRSGFPRSLLRSLGLIVGGGIGFIAASIITTWTAAVGRTAPAHLLSIALNVIILYAVFMVILRFSLPLAIKFRQFRTGAAVAAVGLTILQQLGGYLLKHVTPTSYSALFATTLGLLGWIYLQARVVMYAVVIDAVRNQKAWPRSLSGKELTPADEYALQKRGA